LLLLDFPDLQINAHIKTQVVTAKLLKLFKNVPRCAFFNDKHCFLRELSLDKVSANLVVTFLVLLDWCLHSNGDQVILIKISVIVKGYLEIRQSLLLPHLEIDLNRRVSADGALDHKGFLAKVGVLAGVESLETLWVLDLVLPCEREGHLPWLDYVWQVCG
jgi:hypothetical protein